VSDHTTSRERLSLGVLLAMTAAGVALCGLIIGPFVPGVVWALALMVAAGPLHRWILCRWPLPNLAAGVAVVLVALVLLIPAVFLGWQVGRQLSERIDQVEQQLESGSWRKRFEDMPLLKRGSWCRRFNVRLGCGCGRRPGRRCRSCSRCSRCSSCFATASLLRRRSAP
jgi:predicted PurR-regulated permease PerM